MSAEDWYLNDYEYGNVEYGEADDPIPFPIQPKTKNYQQMWEDLKKYLYSEMKVYNRGTACSIAESIEGEYICKNFLKKMEEIEKGKR